MGAVGGKALDLVELRPVPLVDLRVDVRIRVFVLVRHGEEMLPADLEGLPIFGASGRDPLVLHEPRAVPLVDHRVDVLAGAEKGVRRKKEEGRRKKEEGRKKREERRKKPFLSA